MTSWRAALTLGAAIFVAAPAHAQPSERMLVMPFDNVGRDARIVWLGEASAVLLADDLNALGLDAITREERHYAFERLQVPPAASLTDATVIRIGQLVGASHVIVGTLQMEGDDLVVRARSIALDVGRIRATVSDRGPVRELFATFERLADQLAPPGARIRSGVARDTPSVAAFENYIKGLLAETAATAVRYLMACLKADPSFDRARLALWDVYEDTGEYEKALAAVTAVRDSSRWAPRARFLAGLAQLRLKRYDDAFGTFRTLSSSKPSAAALNNLGIAQLRRGVTGPTSGATYYFTRASETDPAEPDYFFNLGYAHWLERDPGAAIYWLREAVRRNPADGDAHYVLGAALQASGSTTEATREKELARRLSSTYDAWDKRSGPDPVPKGLERLKSDIDLPHARRLEGMLATTGQRDQQELARFYLDRARRLYAQEVDRDALVELNRALFVAPYQAEAHLLMGRVYLRTGRVREAIDALKISLWSEETVAAHVVLAEAYVNAKDDGLARAELERALAQDPSSVDARRMLDQLRAK